MTVPLPLRPSPVEQLPDLTLTPAQQYAREAKKRRRAIDPKIAEAKQLFDAMELAATTRRGGNKVRADGTKRCEKRPIAERANRHQKRAREVTGSPEFEAGLRNLLEVEQFTLTDVALMLDLSVECIRRNAERLRIRTRARPGWVMRRRWDDALQRFVAWPSIAFKGTRVSRVA